MGAFLALAFLTVPVGVLLAVPSAAASCVTDRQPLDRWNPVALPPHAQLRSLVQLDDDPCRLVAADATTVRISQDGGLTWTSTYQAAASRPIAHVFAEGIGADTVVLALEPQSPAAASGGSDSVLVSQDSGRTFKNDPGTGLAQLDVRTAVAAQALVTQTYGETLYVGGRLSVPTGLPADGAARVAAASVYSGPVAGKDQPGGRVTPMQLDPQPQSAAFTPVRLAVDPSAQDSVWAASDASATGGAAPLWHSADAGKTWSPVALPASGRVDDLAFSGRPGAQGSVSALLVAGEFGLLRSVDEGQTWQGVTARAATGVRTEANDPDAVMALIGGRPYRGTASAGLHAVPAGLPARCAAAGLSRNDPRAGSSTFLVSCAPGQYYRYRSSDPGPPPPTLSRSTSSPAPPSPLPPVPYPTAALPTPPTGTPPVLPLVPLRTLDLPGADGTSANLAVVGGVLYYTDGNPQVPGTDDQVTVHRVDVTSGAVQPDFVLRLGQLPSGSPDWIELSADPGRNVLYVATFRGGVFQDGRWHPRMLSYDLGTHALRYLFTAPLSNQVAYDYVAYHYSYDQSLGTFASVIEETHDARHYDRAGQPVDDGCTYDFGAAGYEHSASAVLAAGDGGGAYVELEDDATLLRLDAACRVIAVYGHRAISEAYVENDQMACDPSTFGVAALWLRDAQLKSVTAYALPYGFCAPPVPVHRASRPPVPPVPPPPPAVQGPAPNPQPQPGPVQQPAHQPLVQAQPQAEAQAQAQVQAQQQMQQQGQQQAQVALLPEPQRQPQAATVQVDSQAARMEQAMTRLPHRTRTAPWPAFGVAAALLSSVFGVVFVRDEIAPARQAVRRGRCG